MPVKQFCLAASLVMFLYAAPAAAEKLVFNHRLSAPLEQAFESNDPARLSYNDQNPNYITDVVAVRGTSAAQWIEALVIVARTPDQRVHSAADWLAELKMQAAQRCSSNFTTISQDEISVMFERRSTGCPAGYPPIAIYRAIAGKRSLFLLAAMAKDDISPESWRQWRDVLVSAHIE
jgi:hypothetical protein